MVLQRTRKLSINMCTNMYFSEIFPSICMWKWGSSICPKGARNNISIKVRINCLRGRPNKRWFGDGEDRGIELVCLGSSWLEGYRRGQAPTEALVPISKPRSERRAITFYNTMELLRVRRFKYRLPYKAT